MPNQRRPVEEKPAENEEKAGGEDAAAQENKVSA